MTVAIYLDEGASAPCVKQLVRSLRFMKMTIKMVDRHFFLQPEWDKGIALVVFPGGRDVPYHENLQGDPNSAILRYVEQGGSYLGICAGGYYGCKYIEFERGGELEVRGQRELGFFPGTAVGPAYGNGQFQYGSEVGARAAKLQWENELLHVYYNGGCFFEHAEKHANVSILARYNDIPNQPAAAVLCKVGKGKALLTGVHPEYSTGPEHIFSQMKASEERRVRFWKHLLSACVARPGVRCSAPPSILSS